MSPKRIFTLIPLLVACAGQPADPPASVPAAAPASRPSVAPSHAEPFDDEELPPVVRRLLEPRMVRHGQDFGALYAGVRNERFDEVRRLANAIADESMIARPLPGDSATVNARIPARFFDVQDELESRARALAGAAGTGRIEAVRTAYDALGATCSRCHEAWFPIDEGVESGQ